MNTTLENIALQRARYFTVLDLKNAFWSVQLSPDSRQYTSFVDPLTYARKQWCVTPMGQGRINHDADDPAESGTNQQRGTTPPAVKQTFSYVTTN